MNVTAQYFLDILESGIPYMKIPSNEKRSTHLFHHRCLYRCVCQRTLTFLFNISPGNHPEFCRGASVSTNYTSVSTEIIATGAANLMFRNPRRNIC